MLYPLLSRHYDEIEADLQQFYSINLDDLYTGKLKPSRLLRLILQLPLESRFVKHSNDGKADWDQDTHILASILDTLRMANYQRGNNKGQRPKPIPRPGNQDKLRKWGKTDLAPKDAMERLAKMRRGELFNVEH